MIARVADGGMRDALSLLDQAISFAEEKLVLADILAITGAVSERALTKLIQSVWQGDTVEALSLLEQLFAEGKEPLRLIEDLIYYFRDILLYQSAPEAAHLLERAKVDEPFKEMAAAFKRNWLYQTIESLNGSQQEMKWSAHPKIFLELALIKLLNIRSGSEKADTVEQSSEELQQLVQKVEQLEKSLTKLQKQGVQVTQAEGASATSSGGQRRPKKSLTPDASFHCESERDAAAR